ncbi:MAG: VWA domain-containing protein [Gammaproteobacteria bacterium]|nr:VWA domain-containing protein [Gammaproteobacteria bacterium]MDH5800025.1 VWA domain-containing protein [Gammaproteobacteria bacterium]
MMKKLFIGIGLFAATVGVIIAYPMLHKPAQAKSVTNVAAPQPVLTAKPKTDKQSLIQLAILLDTSSSMDGLINQTREQIWQVVNQFAKSKKDGITPVLQVAVYEYGNNALDPKTGYIRQVTGLTTELDAVSAALFSLTTNGGEEYCGYVIREAGRDLEWSTSEDAIKLIFIAGNEPFNQGPVAFEAAIQEAKQKGITVNTIHAGELSVGNNSGWRNGALLAGGEFMNINHNHVVAHIDAPQDQQLLTLNQKLNQTYIPYGTVGAEKAKRQTLMDEKNRKVSQGLMSKRVISKASKLYRNESWDLVDAAEQGAVDLDKLSNKQLPKTMEKMSKAEQKAYIAKKSKERKQIQEEIGRLSLQREVYVKEQQRKAEKKDTKTMDQALTSAVLKQGKAKGYVFESN